MALLLMRHTRPKVAEGVCYGRLDLDVSETFAMDAVRALDAVKAPARLVTSPLNRCRKLAERAAERFGLPPAIDPRLIEMDFGSWEGVPWSDLPRHELDAWAGDFLHARPHGGESVAMLRHRVTDALQELAGQEGPTLAICHAGVLKVAAAEMGLPDAWRLSVPFGEVLRYG